MRGGLRGKPSHRFSSARLLQGLGLLAIAILLASGCQKALAATSLATTLRELAARQGFLIQGLAHVADLPAPPAEGEIRSRLETLLSAFDHVIVLDREGHVSLVVVGRHHSPPPSEPPVTRASVSTAPIGRAAALMASPVEKAQLTSAFGPRWHPILGEPEFHQGIDLAAPLGVPIRAPAAGLVIEAGWRGGYGRYLRIRHDAALETVYGHLSAYAPGIGPGAIVAPGEVIGFVGASGRATGPHLHYEVRLHGVAVDPEGLALPEPRMERVASGVDLRRALLLARANALMDVMIGSGLRAE
jgi:murein DD-endopeptidase MepM/ murein hydrolase activator NlpD